MKVTVPAGQESAVVVFDNLLDPKICHDFLTVINGHFTTHSTEGRTMGGVDSQTKRSNDMTFSYLRFSEYGIDWTSVMSDIDQSFYTSIAKAVAYYKDQYQALNAWADVEDTGFQVQRYEMRNGYYRPHVDSLPGTSSGDRVLAAMIYLNTVEEGGETRFPLHDVRIKPVAGRIVLFPASWTHLHEGLTPLSGDKWIINTFMVNKQQQTAHDHHADHVHESQQGSDFLLARQSLG